MGDHSGCNCEQAERYFNRPPERLVLDGYRHWTFGFMAGDMDSWQAAWGLYSKMLGTRNGRAALDALSNFVKTLGTCAACPLRMFKQGSPHICRDETLVLGLISAIQHGDEVTTEFCLKHLSCATRCEEVSVAAANFALTLKALDNLLVPIPLQVISNAITLSAQGRAINSLPEPQSRTLH
ncbi:MAG: hypothetical protein ABJO09_08915 [Hyphomicrobiales bacterium]